MTPVDALGAATFVTWLACGLAAVALSPRNRSAGLLLAGAALLTTSRLLEYVATSTLSDAQFAAVRTGIQLAFLLGLAAVVGTLVSFPDGRADRSRIWLVGALAAVAVFSPLTELLGSPTLAIGDVARTNPAAVGWLEGVATLGSVLAATEPLWVVVGVALLASRWRAAGAEERAQLQWALASILLLTVLLVAIVVVEVTGLPSPPEWFFAPLFLGSLALFPVALLVGITRRARRLERRLTESRARLVGAEDDARRRLERDLHDGVQQQLVAVLSLVELTAHQVEHDPAAARQTLREVADQARTAITDLRTLVRGIRPPVLADSGLAAALETELAALPVGVRLDDRTGTGRRWPGAVEAAAYFVAKEAVTNALKHAPGAPVTVVLAAAGADLVVEVRDGGPGLPPAAAGGRGLTGLRDRVESLGGTFEVAARPGAGTVVSARLPAGTRTPPSTRPAPLRERPAVRS